MSLPALSMTPEEIASYNLRKNALDLGLGSQRSKLNYQRGVAQDQYDWDKRQLGYEWDQKYDRLPGSFNRSGMRNSGVFQRALADYAQQRSFSEMGLQRRQTQQMGQFDFDLSDLATQRQIGMNQIDADANARRAQIAAMLRQYAIQ